MVEVEIIARVQVIDLDKAVIQPLHLSFGQRKGRVVRLHVGSLPHGASLLHGRNHGVGFLQGRADRLFDQHVFAGGKSSDCRVALGIGMAEENRVDIRAQQVVEITDVTGDSKAFGDIGRLIGGQVADNGNGKFLVEFPTDWVGAGPELWHHNPKHQCARGP